MKKQKTENYKFHNCHVERENVARVWNDKHYHDHDENAPIELQMVS